MGRKGYVLFLYGIALAIVLRRYYKTNSGLVSPSTIAPTTYLYAILALTSEFLEGLPIIIGTGMTASLYWIDSKKTTTTTKATTKTTTTKPTASISTIIKKVP